MVEIVVQNVTPAEPHQFIFICRQEHLDRFALREVLHLIAPGCEIVPMRQPTKGALCSVLLAAEHLKNDDELVLANADQYVDVSLDEFLRVARASGADGCVMTFPSAHPKWSYAKVEANKVVAVAEKRPISRNATVGIYYFRRSRDFLAGAERMILKRVTLGDQYYVCPVFNELILDHKLITIFPINRDQMYSLGTPEDVDSFLQSKARVLPSKS